MESFDEAVRSCDSALKDAELAHGKWIPIKDIKLEDLPTKMNEIKVGVCNNSLMWTAM